VYWISPFFAVHFFAASPMPESWQQRKGRGGRKKEVPWGASTLCDIVGEPEKVCFPSILAHSRFLRISIEIDDMRLSFAG
jgi:hypothetical protein